MGNSTTCIICPSCGFKECGTNSCPNCGLVMDENGIRRERESFLLCPDCGHAEKGCHFYCPSCKKGIMKIVDAKDVPNIKHIWNGFELTCRCDGCIHVTRMSPDVANEIPYCPFCQEELSVRPEKERSWPKVEGIISILPAVGPSPNISN